MIESIILFAATAFCAVIVAGIIGFCFERQQPRRTVHIDPLIGDFVDEPAQREPVIDIVRRQGPAQRQIDKHNEWRLHHELGTQSQWWAEQLGMEGEPVA